MSRIVALIDMDCFYCQVEEKLDPNLMGKPIAVVQYNQWKGGGIIAVNYIAREKGVTRQMRGDEAKMKCPDIELPRVPQVRGKADLTKYREAGKKVVEVLMTFTNVLERASIDEAYLDLTEAVNKELEKGMPVISLADLRNTFVVGSETTDFLSNIYQNQNSGLCDDDLKLAVGGVIVEKIRAAVFEKTGFQCSAGIAHNKILSKLVCGEHKPNKQTILPQHAVEKMFSKLPVRKIKSLGGKFGNILSDTLKITFIGELLKFSEKELIQTFDEKTGRWLYNIARGIDKEPVQIKLIPKSIGCCKRFPGRTALCKPEEVEHWIKELSCEISERLEEDLKENNRNGRLMTVSFAQEMNQAEVSNTRAIPLRSYEVDKIIQSAVEVLRKNCQKPNGNYHVTFLGLSVGNFESIKNVRRIETYFGKPKKGETLEENVKPEEYSALKSDCAIDLPSNEKNYNESVFSKSEPEDSNKRRSIVHYLNSMKETKKSEFGTSQKFENESTEISAFNCNLKESEYKLELNIEETSNYSDNTIPLDENPSDLIFYDDGFRSEGCSSFSDLSADKTFKLRRISTENENHSNTTDSQFEVESNASITSNSFDEKEICLDSTSPVFGKTDQDRGFFVNYYERPVKRDFDTSKIFREIEESESDTNDDSMETKMDIITDNSIKSGQNAYELSETCSECGDRIPITEILSHQDYHFALKISKENSPYKKRKVETVLKNEKLPRKRKAEPLMKNSIVSFFKKEELDPDEPTELCLECNKRIKLTDFENHTDYHAARKLHLELNKPEVSDRNQIKKCNEITKERGKQKSSPNILLFFKKNI
ncbi:hypothetical protein WA026_016446 [Henosepilachna vigintioctopunctata]|uniref:DNA polymerase eta n=1 Tax=Henosepilachna vigintioctopunctata TaxID=420089 RepID=A0AAW1UL97_9CUCU